MIAEGSFVNIIRRAKVYVPRNRWEEKETRIPGRVVESGDTWADVVFYGMHHFSPGRPAPMREVVHMTDLELREPNMDDPLEFIWDEEHRGGGWDA